MSIEKYDICVVGWGIAGLMTAKKVSHLGYKVALVEEKWVLAWWASTMNEWWLHRWTYHAQSISNQKNAIDVARRCIYGHEQIKHYAPESVEDIGKPWFAIMHNAHRIQDILERWKEAWVKNKKIKKSDFLKIEPTMNGDFIEQVYQVDDVWINVRLLYAKLLGDIKRNWGKIYTNTIVEFKNKISPILKNWVEDKEIEAKLFVYCIGFGVQKFFQKNFDKKISLRLWKSHLLVTSRITEHSIFCLDPWEIGMMNHWNTTVFGMNEDAQLIDTYNTIPMPENIKNLRKALGTMFHMPDNYLSQEVACVKVDLPENYYSARSLGIAIDEPIDRHIIALPGKMTETPYMTDVLTQIIFKKLDSPNIAHRPLDMFNS